MDLNGRVALVTGATRGIGAAIARSLAEAGADVAVGYGKNRKSAEKLASELEDLGSKRTVVVGGNLADPAQVSEMAHATEETLGPVDVLVSNAGIAKRQSFEEITVEDWDQTMDVNSHPACASAVGGASYWSPRRRPSPGGSWERTIPLLRRLLSAWRMHWPDHSLLTASRSMPSPPH